LSKTRAFESKMFHGVSQDVPSIFVWSHVEMGCSNHTFVVYFVSYADAQI